MPIMQVPVPEQQKTYDGLEISVIRLDEDHLLFMAPTDGTMKRYVVHAIDEAVELFRSYVTRLLAQQKVEKKEDVIKMPFDDIKNRGDN